MDLNSKLSFYGTKKNVCCVFPTLPTLLGIGSLTVSNNIPPFAKLGRESAKPIVS